MSHASHIEVLAGGIVICFGLCGQDVADGAEQALIVEQVRPFEGGVFDGLERSPRAAPVDRLFQGIQNEACIGAAAQAQVGLVALELVGSFSSGWGSGMRLVTASGEAPIPRH